MSWRTFVGCLGLLLAVSAFAGETALSGRGEAPYSKKKDAMAAREDAIDRAVTAAVRKALTDLVGDEAMAAHKDVIEQELLPTAAALVTRVEVVSEKDRDKTYEVVIKAWVDEDVLSRNLAALKISQDVGSRRSIAVVIDEYFAGDIAPPSQPMVARELTMSTTDYLRDSGLSATADRHDEGSSRADVDARDQASFGGAGGHGRGSATYTDHSTDSHSSGASASLDAWDTEAYSSFSMHLKEYFPPETLKQPRPDPASAAAIGKQLLQRDARLADARASDEMRRKLVGTSGIVADAANNPAALSGLALELGTSHGVDAILVGTTAIVHDGAISGGHQATASLAVRIVDTATGDIVAYAVRSQSGIGADAQTAASVAAQRLGDLLGKDLGDQLFQYWKKRDEKGIELSLRFLGVQGTRETLVLEDLLRSVTGLEGLAQRMFDPKSGVVEFVGTTRTQPTALRSELLRALYKEPSFGGLEQETSVGTAWTFRIR